MAQRKHQEHLLTPAYIRPNALYALGYAKSKKRSQEILRTLEGTELLPEGLLVRDRINMDSLLSLSQSLMGPKLLNPKEQQGLATYVLGMQQNLDVLGRKFLNLPTAHRPQALYYAGLSASPQDSATILNDLRDRGILDAHLMPLDGSQRFERYKYDFIETTLEMNAGRASRNTLFAFAHDSTERLRDALFPLPAYREPGQRA